MVYLFWLEFDKISSTCISTKVPSMETEHLAKQNANNNSSTCDSISLSIFVCMSYFLHGMVNFLLWQWTFSPNSGNKLRTNWICKWYETVISFEIWNLHFICWQYVSVITIINNNRNLQHSHTNSLHNWINIEKKKTHINKSVFVRWHSIMWKCENVKWKKIIALFRNFSETECFYRANSSAPDPQTLWLLGIIIVWNWNMEIKEKIKRLINFQQAQTNDSSDDGL